ncbi:MAG: Type I restriction-modification system, specificity subunit S [Arenicellales bacterium IbO2]|nr:MAG: Type I restriction-modification system, specificity subunit S [Arenicellales bacterium IbO2]
MSGPGYAERKKSGVAWLGDVPAHWEMKQLKHGLQPGRSGGLLVKSEMFSEPAEGLFPGFSASGQDVWVDHAQYRESAIVLSAVGARCGKTFKADGAWTAIANTHVLRIADGFCRDYLWYLTNNESFWIRGGTAQPYVRVAATLREKFAFPPLEEQLVIADYLDRRTEQIDTLIEKKQQQILLLKEKRIALISHAVTKGLDSNAAMKNSGVSWLGKVPAHWDVWKLKHCAARFYSGGTPDSGVGEYYCAPGEGLPWLMISDMTEQRMVSKTAKAITESGRASKSLEVLPAGTLLFSMYASLGTTAVLKIPACVNQAILGIEFNPKSVNADFGLYFMESLRPHVARFSSQSTQLNLNAEKVGALPIFVPPIKEQTAIASQIDRETARVDGLIEKIEKSINLLREHRTALISAAVTGKIDVQ